MAGNQSRTLPRTPHHFVNSADVTGERMLQVEGNRLEGEVPNVKVVLVTDQFSFCEYTKFKGTKDPNHAHADHETFRTASSWK